MAHAFAPHAFAVSVRWKLELQVQISVLGFNVVWVRVESGPVSSCQLVASATCAVDYASPLSSLSGSTGLFSSAPLLCVQPLQLSGNGKCRYGSAVRLSWANRQLFSYSQPLQPLTSPRFSWNCQLDFTRLTSGRLAGLSACLHRSVSPPP